MKNNRLKISFCGLIMLAVITVSGCSVSISVGGNSKAVAETKSDKAEKTAVKPLPTATPVPEEKTAEPAPEERPLPTETPAPVETPKAVQPAAEMKINYPTYYVVNCNVSITLRPKPDVSSGEICQIPLGSAVSYVESAENGFYKIIYNGLTGFSLASYLSTNPQSTAPAQQTNYETYYVVNCNESITLRTSPSTSADEICQIPLGAAVSYVSTAENGFYYICYNGNYGYSLASYLSSYSGSATYETCRVVNCNESITLRTSPSTSAGEICQIPLGETVSYIGSAGNGFYEIYYMGNRGYSLASYLEFQ